MILLDSLLMSGLKFVLGAVRDAVETELNSEERLREELLAAQMRVEMGELSESEYAKIEKEILTRLREIRRQKQGSESPGELKVTGIETSVEGESG